MTNREFLELEKEYFDQQVGWPYPVSNQIVRKIMYIYQFDDKIADFIYNSGAKVTKIQNKCPREIQFPNGQTYFILTASDSARGYRAYKAIIDERIPFDILQTVVMPSLANYCCHLEII